MSPALITIYSTPGCGWAVRNYAALIEKGIPFTIAMAKDAGGRKTEDFLAISPYARTPVMTVNGDVVWDSLHMNYFIDELFPEPALMPDSPLDRAQAVAGDALRVDGALAGEIVEGDGAGAVLAGDQQCGL